MSAPKALKARSLRDSLGKTVRLLTKQGVDVRFRGHQPYVKSRGNKVICLTLPEINDNAPDALIEGIQGFLDHEVGHIFYTPFGRLERFTKRNRVRMSMSNIIEDIRLEKLLPRDLPGTKENLERMYDSRMDDFFAPGALKANEPGMSKNEACSRVMVSGLRALAGQKAFKRFMDDNNLWVHLKPLTDRMPDLSKRLREMEDFRDVEQLVEDILEALKPPPKPKPEKGDEPEQTEQDADFDPDAAGNMAPDEEDDADDSESESDGGEGHGDGEGTDDEEGDEDDTGSCAGGDGEDEGDPADGDGDEEGDTGSGGDEDDNDSTGETGGDHEEGDDESDTPADNDLEGDPRDSKFADEGKPHRTLNEALSMLEPRQRRALFLYKKRKQTVAEIADDLSVTEDETREILASARKRLRELLNGG